MSTASDGTTSTATYAQGELRRTMNASGIFASFTVVMGLMNGPRFSNHQPGSRGMPMPNRRHRKFKGWQREARRR